MEYNTPYEKNRDHQKEISKLCWEITKDLYGYQTTTKKVSKNVFVEYLKIAYYISMCNTFTTILLFMKENNDWTIDEIYGALQIDLKDIWSALSTSRYGYKFFKPLSLDDITNCDDPSEILKKGFLRKK